MEVEAADTFLKKLRGLMFRKGLDHALIFPLNRESRMGASIHSLFVFFPFDAVFLNEKKQVVDARTVRPFTWNVTPKKPAKYIIELPEGTIAGMGRDLCKIGGMLKKID